MPSSDPEPAVGLSELTEAGTSGVTEQTDNNNNNNNNNSAVVVYIPQTRVETKRLTIYVDNIIKLFTKIKSQSGLLGKVVVIVSLMVAALALWPTFSGTAEGRRATLLAEWTAKKDFFEFCESHDWEIEGCNVTQVSPPGPPPVDSRDTGPTADTPPEAGYGTLLGGIGMFLVAILLNLRPLRRHMLWTTSRASGRWRKQHHKRILSRVQSLGPQSLPSALHMRDLTEIGRIMAQQARDGLPVSFGQSSSTSFDFTFGSESLPNNTPVKIPEDQKEAGIGLRKRKPTKDGKKDERDARGSLLRSHGRVAPLPLPLPLPTLDHLQIAPTGSPTMADRILVPSREEMQEYEEDLRAYAKNCGRTGEGPLDYHTLSGTAKAANKSTDSSDIQAGGLLEFKYRCGCCLEKRAEFSTLEQLR